MTPHDTVVVAGSSPRTANRFAVVLAYRDNEMARVTDLLSALCAWEPQVGWVLLIEDFPQESGFSEAAPCGGECRVLSIKNPRVTRPVMHWADALNVGILRAWSLIQRETDADFVLKIDTDALVIGPFAEAVRACMRRTPDAGLIGSYGFSCHPAVRPIQDMRGEPPLLTFRRLLPREVPPEGAGSAPAINGLGVPPPSMIEAFKAVRPHIDAAVANGYEDSVYCQGGACVATRVMLDRMADAGYFADVDRWLDIRCNDDQMWPMYCRAVGLRLCDCSHPGEPFGVQYRALPYSPQELIDLGYSLIHCIKNDPRWSEDEIREFFRTRRSGIVERTGSSTPPELFDAHGDDRLHSRGAAR